MNEPRFPVAAAGGPQFSRELLRFERLLADVSSRFIDLPPGRIDEAITDGLQRIVAMLGVDRATLSTVDPRTGQFHSTHSCAAPGFALVPATVSSRTYPWALARYGAGLPVVFARLDDLPPEAALDRASYASLQLRSHVGVPVIVSGEFVAVLGFGALRAERTWPDDLVARMRLLGDIFGSALARKRVQDRIEELLRFERLLADLSASLLGTCGADLDGQIDAALRNVGTLLGADRCALWVLRLAPRGVIATHQWAAEGVPAPPRKVNAAEIPWIMDAVVAGNVVAFNERTALPPDAGADLIALCAAGVQSLLAIPLRTGVAVVGALSLSCVRDARAWPDEIVPRLQVFGKMLASALVHRDAERSAQRATSETALYRERLAHLARVEAVGAMSAAVAHEVNQPLMAIGNYAQAGRRRLAGGGPVDLERLAGLLEKIGDQATLAGRVLDQLRAMVRRREPEEAEIDLSRLLGNAVRLIELEGRIKDVRIELAVAPDLPRALGDEVQIQQVILNLAHNAMEAMAASPLRDRKLRLEATTSDGDVIAIRVIDRGPGIAAADGERIFEPFYTTKGTGLGIGLAICRTIVEAHGGKLWHCPGEDGGTAFQFTLPQANDGA